MYEPTYKLKIKVNAGVEKAKQELEYRELKKIELPLMGIKEEVICLVVTDEILSGVKSIQTVYQKVTKRNKVQDIILLDAYHSATIEGARTTVDHVKKAFSKPNTKDDKMVVNTVKGFDYAYQNPIDQRNIRTLWEIVVAGVCENESKAGLFYRDGTVFIRSETKIIHVPAKSGQIEDLMNQLFLFLENSELEDILIAFVLHFYFVYVHSF